MVKSKKDNRRDFVLRIESINQTLEEEKGEYMARCKVMREDIKEVLDEAKESGLAKKAVKSVVAARDLERRAEAARAALDPEQQDEHDQLRLALGDYEDAAPSMEKDPSKGPPVDIGPKPGTGMQSAPVP